MNEVDDYFAGLDDHSRAAFDHIRLLAVDVAPTAVQGLSYGMPALKLEGKGLLAFHAARRHLSVYPCSGWAVDAVRDRLAGFSLSRGTIRFTPDHPIPDDVVRDLVGVRAEEIQRGRPSSLP